MPHPGISARRLLSAIAVACLTAAGCGHRAAQPAAAAAAMLRPVIVRTLPHDPQAFTQGLLFFDGRLYESTGAPNGTGSSLRILDTASGTVLKKIEIPNAFAEGIALLGDRLVQLTWRDQVAVIYSFPELGFAGTVRYDGEGWGLTSDRTSLSMSNGSDTLVRRDAAFKVLGRTPVRYRGAPLRNLNELEFVDGRIWANVWYSSYIFEIDPADGSVLRVADCAALADSAAPASQNDVLNGIAANGKNGTLYLTGKNWRLLFEVRIPPAPR